MTTVLPLAKARRKRAASVEPESYRRLTASPGLVTEEIEAVGGPIESHHSPAMARTIGQAWITMAETAERMEAEWP